MGNGRLTKFLESEMLPSEVKLPPPMMSHQPGALGAGAGFVLNGDADVSSP